MCQRSNALVQNVTIVTFCTSPYETQEHIVKHETVEKHFHCHSRPRSVIPAKAGIQFRWFFWIPAFPPKAGRRGDDATD